MAKNIRNRVLAEITVTHIVRLAMEHGFPMTRDNAFAFLNENGNAYEMWMQMMHAAEDFIERNLGRIPIKHERQIPIRASLSAQTSESFQTTAAQPIQG